MNLSKTKLKRGLTGATLLLIFLLAGILGKVQYEKSKMRPLETGEVIPGIYAVKTDNFVNFFLVSGEKGYIMFDAGSDKSQTGKQLALLGISPEEVIAVFLTHSDSDHVASVELFEKATIYLPEKETLLLDGTVKRNLIGGNKLKTPYSTLHEDEGVIMDGHLIQTLETPGHTPGSMCYIVDRRYLFTGDTLSIRDGKAAPFNPFYNMDTEEAKNSISKIGQLKDIAFIFTGHYGYSDDFNTMFSEWNFID